MILGCNVWCWSLGCGFFAFFLGCILMYCGINHNILVSKSCGGDCRKLLSCERLLREYQFHSQCSLPVVMVAM